MLTIDGKNYDVLIRYGTLHRSFEIREGPASVKFLDGDEDPDIVGTYYNYAMEIDARSISPAQYDSLFEVLSAPVKSHTVTFPYGQSTLTFEARITSGSDTFQRKLGGKNRWGGLAVQFRAKAPKRRPA